MGRGPYFFGVAYEVSLVVVQALIMLAEVRGVPPSFNLNDIKNHISHQDLEQLKEQLDYIDTPEAKQLSRDMRKILSTPPDYYSKVTSSLRVALTELTAGNVGRIIGKADENRFIKRLEQGQVSEDSEGIILVVQLGSLLTKRAAYTAGKVIISMIQAFAGRVYSSGKNLHRFNRTTPRRRHQFNRTLGMRRHRPGRPRLIFTAREVYQLRKNLRLKHQN